MTLADDIKDKVDLVDLIGREVTLTREGHHFTAPCPFHNENTPSFHVYPDSHYHCFGCGAHGDVFTWVQVRRGVDFREALRELARLAGVVLRDEPVLTAARAAAESRSALLGRAVELYASLLTEDARAYLARRGFTDAFVASYRIGWAPGGVVRRITGATTDDLKSAGLLNEDGRDVLYNRVTFPIYGPGDTTTGIAGRAFPDREPKYLAVPAGPSPLLHESGLRDASGRGPNGTRFVYLCEGDTDTATLVQAGLPVVGVRGVNGLKDEFGEKFAKVDTIYVCADADKAGPELVHRAGRLFGNKARIVSLPDGEDVNSWVAQKGGDITALTAVAPTYLDWMIGRLPGEIKAEDVEGLVASFVPALLALGKAAQEAYAKRISRAIGITVGPIREQVREASTKTSANGHATKNGVNGHGGDLGATRILWADKPLINPAQAIHEGVVYTTVFLDKIIVDPETGSTKIATVPHVVNSRREVFELTEAEMFARGLHYAPTKVPTVGLIRDRWSVAPERPFSVKSFIDGGAKVAPWSLYRDVRGFFTRHVDYPNPAFHDFLALWTIGTYFFELFPAYPYIHLYSTMRAGKTLTLEIVEGLAFNAVMSSSLSGAAAYRTVEACSATLLIDEAENLETRGKKPEADNDNDKIEILKAGYKRGGRAIRCAGDNHEPTAYDVYSPKMFGSVGQIDSVLRDRVITLTLARKREGVKLDEFQRGAIAAGLANARDQLYCLMLDHARDIEEQIGEGIDWSGVRDRDRELWTPILVMAEFFDNYAVEDLGAASIPEDDLLIVRMRRLAFESAGERAAQDRLEQTELLLLEAVLAFLDQATPILAGENWYASKGLLTFVREQDGLEWIKESRRIYNELQRVTAISKRRDIGQKTPPGGKATRCIRLVRATIEDVATRLGVRVPVKMGTTGTVGSPAAAAVQ